MYREKFQVERESKLSLLDHLTIQKGFGVSKLQDGELEVDLSEKNIRNDLKDVW